MTVEQLRKKVDLGGTGDKVSFPDPAAAPLGTDEEAAGTPPSTAAVDLAKLEERNPEGTSPGATDETSRDYSGDLVRHPHSGRIVAIIVFVLGALAAAFAAFLYLLERSPT